jgi:two-component system sensor histidine kinase TtrS
MRLEEVDIKQVTKEAVQLFTGMLSLPPQVEIIDLLGQNLKLIADPVQIQQALINLLKNGYDAMGEAGIKNQLIQVILWRSEQQVHLTVQDNGLGLSEEAYANI